MGVTSFGSLLVVLSLWHGTQAAEDKVPYMYWGTAGKGNAGQFTVKSHVGYEYTEMISNVNIGYLQDDAGKQTLVCVGYDYGTEGPNPCTTEAHPGLTIDSHKLDRNEYITEVSGIDVLYIQKISIKTSTGREIGPYGTKDQLDTFVASNGGRPLLYSDMKQSYLYLLEINFVFLGKHIYGLKPVCDEVSREVYNNINNNVVGLESTAQSYKRKLYHSARLGCEIPDKEHPETNVAACNLQSVLQQVNIMVNIALSHWKHTPINLVSYSEYSSGVLLSELESAKSFHSLLTSMEFGAQTIINVTEQQSGQLREYYKAQAEFNKQIAEKDVAYLNQTLIRVKKGSEESADIVTDRLTRIIDNATGVINYETASSSFRIVFQIARCFNPFKMMFGGPDKDATMDAFHDFADAIQKQVLMEALKDALEEYVNLNAKIANNIAKNQDQIEAMNEITEKFDKIQDQAELEQTAKDFIQSYGDYTPALYPEDIAYLSALLNEIGAQGCAIILDNESILIKFAEALYDQVMKDCIHFAADQAMLDTYYQETYGLQFDLVDALTNVVRYSYSEQMADQIGSIHTSIDIQKAAMETIMIECQVQTIAAVRCDRLQYISAGKRPGVCMRTLFSDTEVGGIIAAVPSLSYSDEVRFAYYPTSLQKNSHQPFISIERLLQGEAQTINIPFNDTAWLQQYQWLPGHFDEETAFYFKNIEAFVPALKCGDKEMVHIFIEMTNGNIQKLYKQTFEPTFSITRQKVKFHYETDTVSCPGEHEVFRVMKNDTEIFDIPDKEETFCVTSKGDYPQFDRDDNTLPSVFNSWDLRIFSDEGCELGLDEDYGFHPMVTFKMVLRSVDVRTVSTDEGLNECWPDGSRCPEGLFCHNEMMSYTCETTKQLDKDIARQIEDRKIKELMERVRGKYLLQD